MRDLSDGLEMNIREHSNFLSKGQRHLVVFAKILLRNSWFFILDETTTRIDPFNETRIQEAKENLMQGRTSIIIAHRFRTERRVDRITNLDYGKIVEDDNHDSRMSKDWNYVELYNTYFKH